MPQCDSTWELEGVTYRCTQGEDHDGHHEFCIIWTNHAIEERFRPTQETDPE